MLYLSLRQFEYVAAVARARSLSAAAAALNVSQPSLSVAISQVERRIGQRLFTRKRGSPAQLTAFGETYLASVQEILALARRLDDPKLSAFAESAQITLGIFDDLAPIHLGRLLDLLRTQLPEADIRYRVADFETLEREMLLGRIDMALTFDAGLDASFVRQRLTSMRPNVLLSKGHPLAGLQSIALKRLRGQPLILSEVGLSLRHMLALFRRVGIDPVVVHRARSLELLRSLAAHGEGVGLAYVRPSNDVAYDGAALVSIPVSDAIAEQDVILARPREGRKTATAEAAGRIILAAFAKAKMPSRRPRSRVRT